MRRIIYRLVLMIICLGNLVSLFGCGATQKPDNIGEDSAVRYYSKEDFSSITIEESTYQDVCTIALPES